MMFQTMSGFLWFFIPTLIAILIGIVIEHKLIRFERRMTRVFLAVIKTIKEAMQ